MLPVIGSAALVIALTALFTLTRPDPELVAALAETTTTTSTTIDLDRPIDFENFTVDQIAQGDPLDWEKVLELDDLWGLDMVWTGEMLHVFGVDSFFPTESRHPLAHWTTTDGVSWKPGGTFGSYAGYSVPVLHGERLAIAAAHDTGITLATTFDGIRWEESEINVAVGDFFALAPGPILVDDNISVVAFSQFLALEQRLEILVEDHLGIEIADGHRWISWRPLGTDDMTIEVFGPFGIRLAELAGSELGLNPASIVEANQGFPGNRGTTLFVSGEEQRWTASEIPGIQWLQSIVLLPDGSLLASGYSEAGSTHWTSTDGLVWSLADISAPVDIHPFEGGYIGLSDEITNQLLLSHDGQTWESLATADLLPRRVDLQFSTVAAGPGGIAATAITFFNSRQPSGRRPLAELEAGSTLSIDILLRTITLTVEDEDHVWNLAGVARPEWVEVDLDTLDIHVAHPETGDHLATVALDDLRDLEAEEALNWGTVQHSAFIFTPNPYQSDWTIQDLAQAMGDDGFVTNIVVTDEEVYLLAQRRDVFSTEPAGFSVWRAPIP